MQPTMKQWMKIIKDWEKVTDTHVSGFDPMLSGYDKQTMNCTYQVPLWLVQRIIALAKKK